MRCGSKRKNQNEQREQTVEWDGSLVDTECAFDGRNNKVYFCHVGQTHDMSSNSSWEFIFGKGE